MCSSSTVKEPFSARVQFTLSVAIQESYGAKDFLQSISGKILARHDNDERESGAGYITATLVQFGGHTRTTENSRRWGWHWRRHRRILGASLRCRNRTVERCDTGRL